MVINGTALLHVGGKSTRGALMLIGLLQHRDGLCYNRPTLCTLVNIHNNGIWLPDAVNAILNLTALFRFLMHQKPFRPRYSE